MRTLGLVFAGSVRHLARLCHRRPLLFRVPYRDFELHDERDVVLPDAHPHRG